ncbi:hypothetical protein [Saccharopolyspora hattusasensis]|uniref:hypothetical protein n=1 Tax=Saccharopolyspora hattusasensis TaxID=1128679 RepID=UPI003D98E357
MSGDSRWSLRAAPSERLDRAARRGDAQQGVAPRAIHVPIDDMIAILTRDFWCSGHGNPRLIASHAAPQDHAHKQNFMECAGFSLCARLSARDWLSANVMDQEVW